MLSRTAANHITNCHDI